MGLKGKFGNAFLGRWDSPYKSSTAKLDPFDISGIGSYQNILGQLQTAANSADNFFDARLSNGFQYWSPDWAGFSFRLGYAPNEGRNSQINPHVVSLSGQYANGPIYLTLAHEQRKRTAASSTAPPARAPCWAAPTRPAWTRARASARATCSAVPP